MNLSPWLDYVAAGTEHDLGVLRPETDLAFQDDRELIFTVMDVRRDKGRDLEAMFHDGDSTIGVPPIDLEGDADARHERLHRSIAGTYSFDAVRR
jgi:hypothetical protein